MIKSLKIALAAAATLGGVALSATGASAMPAVDGSALKAVESSTIQDVRLVCGPYRCFHRPGFFHGGYGPRPFFGPRFGHHHYGHHRFYR